MGRHGIAPANCNTGGDCQVTLHLVHRTSDAYRAMITSPHPVRLIALLFAGGITIGTALLMLPIAKAGPGGAPFIVALFHATSSLCVTGLITVDTATYWTPFGQAVILGLIQIGGLGLMTAAVLLGFVAGRNFRLRDRMATHVERSRLNVGDARSVLHMVLGVTIMVEGVLALWLILRLHIGHGEAWGTATWNGLFHAISAFNNAGFSTYTDSVMGFQSDPWVLIPIAIAIIIAAVGFPVYQEVRIRPFDGKHWSLHTKITVLGTAILLVGGFAWILMVEWNNPLTLGPMSWGDKALNAFFHAVMPRTAGFNSLNVGDFEIETLVANYILMFIGGGSAGTAGGIKITTVFILIFVVWSEARGREDTSLFGRQVPRRVERQALSVTVLAALLVTLGTVIILGTTPHRLVDVVFEVISAFATVGLSTGITASLPPVALSTLVALMFIGRVGTITIATALALHEKPRRYRYPEESPIVG